MSKNIDLKRKLAILDDETLGQVIIEIKNMVNTSTNKTYSFWMEILEVINDELSRRMKNQLDDGFTNNVEIRRAVRDKNLKMYKIAERLGVSATHFSRMLQTELSSERKKQVMNIIEEM